MKIILIVLFVAFFYTSYSTCYGGENYLAKCWEKEGDALRQGYLKLSFTETANRLYHSKEPWQTYRNASYGTVWTNANSFYKNDTIKGKKDILSSFTQLNGGYLLIKDFGDTIYTPVTERDAQEYLYKSARYSPVTILSYFFLYNRQTDIETDKEFAIYEMKIAKTIVRLYIRKKDYLLAKVTTLTSEEILGDVANPFIYENYSEF